MYEPVAGGQIENMFRKSPNSCPEVLSRKTDCGAAKRDAVRANPAPRQEKTDLLKKSKRRRNRHLEHIRHWQFPKENVFLQDKQNKHRWTAKPSEDRRNAANLAGPRFQNSVQALSNGTNKTSK